MSDHDRARLRTRDFLSLRDFSSEELSLFFQTAQDLKRKLRSGEDHEALKGKTLAMIFHSPSTRTRVSFETGMQQLGGHAQMITSEQFWGKERESLKDSAKVFSRYVDGVTIRTVSFDDIVEFAKWADVPVINAYCDKEHPCQVMADLMTTTEKKGTLSGKKTAIVWANSSLNKSAGIVNSTLYVAPKVGMDLSIACPEGYEPDPSVVAAAKREAEDEMTDLTITHDMREALDGADVVHIKAWVPLYRGLADLTAPHLAHPEKYKDWLITPEKLQYAKRDVNIQHALPVERGVEALDEILDGPNSVIYDEAENRLHVQKAILALLLS